MLFIAEWAAFSRSAGLGTRWLASVDASLPRWKKHRFIEGHPNQNTHYHQERSRKCWPIYRAKRLPDFLELDIEQLNDDDSVEVKKRSLKRELYAQGALIMFKPFRTLADLCGPSDLNWWAAYLRFRPLLEKDDRSVTILGNMQNFYVSFCRSGNSAA